VVAHRGVIMQSFLKQATEDDVDSLVGFLMEMQNELRELDLDPVVTRQSILNGLKENVFWFLFVDEAGKAFGTCYLQSLHNYWRVERRYYLGGFYIAPSHRGQGHFRVLNGLLKDWAESHDGIQIYCHIHEDNIKSLQSFASVGVEATEYNLCVHQWRD
jgi:RimJ/RimL family protein N-acetyltransferase